MCIIPPHNEVAFLLLKKEYIKYMKKTENNSDDNQKKVDYSLLKRIFKEIAKPQLKLIITGMVFMICFSAIEGYSITLLKPLLDDVFLQKNLDILSKIGVLIVLCYFSKNLFNYFANILISMAGMRAGIDLRKRIFSHIISLDMDYLNKTTTGRLLNHVNVEAAAVLAIATNTLAKVVKHIMTCLIMFFIMVYYGRYMFFILIFLIPTIGITIKLIVNRMRKLTRKVFDINNRHASIVLQIMNGLSTVKSYTKEKDEVEKIYEIEKDLYKQSMKQIKVSSAQTPIVETFVGIGMAVALFTGGYFISKDYMSAGDFVAFMVALTAAYKPLKSLLGMNNQLQSGLIGAERVYEFLDTKPKIVDYPNAKNINDKKIDIEFDNVNFAYDKADGNVLNNISFKVPAGKVCAFVGPSGSGKSTIMNLLLRFYDIESGDIKLANKSIKDIKIKSLREKISYVSQDAYMFGASIRDNIKYGRENATIKEIEKAAKMASCGFITEDLPQGFDTIVGEKGVRLSGGQKQRISIARSLLKNSPVLLLDEATSALDTKSEKDIQKALKTLMKNRTTFVIAHRLSTIIDADIICVLDKGEIVEMGKHEELLAKKGMYKKLYDIQFKGKDKKSKV